MIKTSAPGNIVLFGEHAVLMGEPAIGCAVNKRIYVTINPRTDNQVIITSALGNYQGSTDYLPEDSTHRFSVCLLKQWQEKLQHGLDIIISSEFSHTVGLGSSAALTVAMTAAIHYLFNLALDRQKILTKSLEIIRKVQGCGSGLDLATSTYGGVIQYLAHRAKVTPLTDTLPLTLYYSGYKKTTPEILKEINIQVQKAPRLYQQLYKLMGICSHEAGIAIQGNNLSQLGLYMNYYHGLMDALGVCDQTLADMTYTLRGQSAIHGVKISGSGLGDCIVALGTPAKDILASQRIDINVTSSGVRLESNTL